VLKPLSLFLIFIYLGMNPENKGLSIGNCPELAQVEIPIKIKLERWALK